MKAPDAISTKDVEHWSSLLIKPTHLHGYQPNQTYSRHSLVHPHLSLVSLCVECGEERVLERRVLSRPLQVAVHFARR